MSHQDDRTPPFNNPQQIEAEQITTACKIMLIAELLFFKFGMPRCLDWVAVTFDTRGYRCEVDPTSDMLNCYSGAKACWVVFMFTALVSMMMLIFQAYLVAVIYIADGDSKNFWKARWAAKVFVRAIALFLAAGIVTSITLSMHHVLMERDRIPAPTPTSTVRYTT